MKNPFRLLVHGSVLALWWGLTASCHEKEKTPDEEAQACAVAFAQAYFNFDFEGAARLASPESRRWLQFAASNTNADDLQQYNAGEAPATVSDDDSERADDSTHTVSITVEHCLLKTALGQPSVMTDEATFRLSVVCRQGHYYVRMAGPLRSERQSRD